LYYSAANCCLSEKTRLGTPSLLEACGIRSAFWHWLVALWHLVLEIVGFIWRLAFSTGFTRSLGLRHLTGITRI
jgi:hypothetical protein